MKNDPAASTSPARRVASRIEATQPDGTAELIVMDDIFVDVDSSPSPPTPPPIKRNDKLGLTQKLQKVFSHGDLQRQQQRHDSSEDDSGEDDERKPLSLSPPRRMASRVRTLGDAAEVVLDDTGYFSDEGLCSSTTDNSNIKKKDGFGLRRFKSSPREPTRGRSFALSSLKRAPIIRHDHSATARPQRQEFETMVEDDMDEDESPLFNSDQGSIPPKKMSRLQKALSLSPLSRNTSPGMESASGSNDVDNYNDNDGLRKDNDRGNSSDDENTISESVDTSANDDAVYKKSKCKIILIGMSFLVLMGGVGFGTYYLIDNSSSFATKESSSNSSNSSHYENYVFDDGTTSREHPEPISVSNASFNNGVEPEHVVPSIRLNATTSTSNPTSITFYAMADAPYTDYERANIMPQQIANLSSTNTVNGSDGGASANADEAAFLVHLGDLQYARVDECREPAYQNASDILKQSSLPVFVLPGDNDINDCETLEHGSKMWITYFHKLDELWNHNFKLLRWGDLDESFAFLHNNILFMGLNIIGGTPHSYDEWSSRHAMHLEMIKSLMTTHKDEYAIAVLFGHASPGTNHADFFEGKNGLANFVSEMNKPFLHLHGDDHEWSENEGAFGVENYMMVCLDAGENAPPIKVEIDTSRSSNMIRIDRMEDGLEVDCCSDGWPRLDDEGAVKSNRDDDGYDDGDT